MIAAPGPRRCSRATVSPRRRGGRFVGRWSV